MGTLALRSQYRQLQRSQQSAAAMAPILNSAFNFDQIHQDSTVPTMSRTHQYRKVMKPLLERKRRARINKCLDELKDLMVFAIQSEGDAINKLEKADVLELTVQHLQKLKHQKMLHVAPLREHRLHLSRSGTSAPLSHLRRRVQLWARLHTLTRPLCWQRGHPP